MMEEKIVDAFMSGLIKMSLRGIVIIFVVLLVRLLLKKLRISHKYILGLWAMAFLYFIFPWKLSMSVGFWNNVHMPEEVRIITEPQSMAKERQGEVDDAANIVNIANAPGTAGNITVDAPAALAADNMGTITTMSVEPAKQNMIGINDMKKGSSKRLKAESVTGFLWLAGLVPFFGHMLYSYFALKRRLEVSILFEDNVWWAEDIDMPIVFGLIRPQIYLPISMRTEDLSYVIAHEKMHIKRKDGLFKMLVYIVCLLHWFNPFIWIAYSLFGSDMEKACDEEVIRTMGREKRKEYAYALLHIATGKGSRKKRIFVAPICFDEGNVKSRIRNVMKYKYTLPGIGTAVVIVILALSVMFLTEAKDSNVKENAKMEELPDTYVEESDYPYKQWSDGVFYPKLQQTDGRVYLYHNNFIYYIEEGRNVIMPLCNKADCLHDREPDTEKWADCNAHVDFEEGDQYVWQDYVQVAKCNDSVYCMNSNAFNRSQTLFRFATDGTAKEEVYTWDSKASTVMEWIIHRDILYYVERLGLENTVKALALTGADREPETIYTPDENLNVMALGRLKAYGNHVYFYIDAEGYHTKNFVYNLQEGKVKELDIPGLPDSAQILGVQFFQDKIVIDPYDNAKEGNEPETVYLAELDGGNPMPLLENIPQAGYFMSDGEYLYLFDDWMPEIDDWLANPGLYTVYDKDLNIVDTFRAPVMPNGRPVRLPVGEKNRMYYLYEDKENDIWSVMCWDKSKIGSYHGETFSMTEIMYP